MNSSIKSFIIIAPVFLCLFLNASLSFAQKKEDAAAGANKLYGNATILTNYIDKGLTQSDKTYSLQAGFGYKMGPQAHIGIWGSSVKLPSNTENLNLRAYFDVKIDFSQNSNMVLRYDFNQYFRSETHNGNILSADFSTFGYHVIFEQNSNWEGSTNASTWYGLSRDFNLPYSLLFTPQVGYNQLATTGYTNYFDARVGLGYKFADVIYQLAATYATESYQFNGQGDPAIFLVIKANF
jgi:uncharacterized protein (TIGR02001 family)